MSRLLVVIDVQRDYFPGGAFPLVGPEAAAQAAGRVLAAFRAAGEPVVHVRHEEVDDAAPFLRAGTEGAETHADAAPVAGERVLVKHLPNAFLGTDLAGVVAASGADELVVLGMMTSMCVDATVRAALDAEHRVTVVADACAAPDLTHAGTTVPGHLAHAAFLAALGQAGASVVDADDVVGALAG